MLKKYLYHSAKIISVLLVLGTVGFYWLTTFAPSEDTIKALKLTKKSDLPYLTAEPPASRGKILALVTSVNKIGKTKKKTGYELTELSRAYWVFSANGFEVDIASPQGGKAPMVRDGDDMGAYDYAFLNDANIQAKINNTLKVEDVKADDYEAVYFIGGKGAMFDFPDNTAIQNIVKKMYQSEKVISAVCHGPAALVNVKLDNGKWLLEDATVSAFTNDEELFLIPEAEEIFPFLLQDELVRRGAKFNAGSTYLEKISSNNKLITGQNPWSVWSMSEQVIKTLGYQPIARQLTAEENSINLLMAYEDRGFDAVKKTTTVENLAYQPMLIVMHSLISVMKLDFSKSVDLLRLASAVK